MALEGRVWRPSSSDRAVARTERVVAGRDGPFVFVRATGKVRNTRSRGKARR